MLVSDVQQSHSIIHIHVSIILEILFPLRLLQDMSSVPCTVQQVLVGNYFKYRNVYMSILKPQSTPPTLPPW